MLSTDWLIVSGAIDMNPSGNKTHCRQIAVVEKGNTTMHAILFCLLSGVPPVADAEETSAAARERVYFAFDDQAIPWKDNLRLTLQQAEKHAANPVLRCGPKGSPDATHALIYGSVLRIDGKFRMWYLGMFEPKWDHRTTGWWRPMCYAESEDGVHWTKPDLGLVEFNGNRKNNICLIESDPHSLSRVNDFLSVIYEPDEPDPARRYKCAYIAHMPIDEVRGGCSPLGPKESRWCAVVCATSADGLRWRVLGDRPANSGGERFEVAGLYRFGGFYYLTGQLISPWTWLADGRDVGRVMLAFRSPDFQHWSRAKALAFARPGQTTSPPISGQQTHMGAGLWNRGNVLVGLYGMWQDGPQERPKDAGHLWGTRIDLGLVVSDDGIHFREPVPDFKVIPRGGEGQWDSIALTQGHAFANVGDRTYIWYAHWDCEGAGHTQEIGLATLRRDGFGYLATHAPGMPGHFVTCPIDLGQPEAKLLVNADGISSQTPLTIELVDDRDQPLAGYSGEQAAKLTSSGTRQEVIWPASQSNRLPAGKRVAVKVSFPADSPVRVYALYIADSVPSGSSSR